MKTTREEVDALVRQLLTDNFDCDVTKLNDETNMFAEFDLDSIDAVDLVVEVQTRYSISLKPDDFKNIHNSGGLVDVITDTINAAN